jgi:hypothetical protein
MRSASKVATSKMSRGSSIFAKVHRLLLRSLDFQSRFSQLVEHLQILRQGNSRRFDDKNHFPVLPYLPLNVGEIVEIISGDKRIVAVTGLVHFQGPLLLHGDFPLCRWSHGPRSNVVATSCKYSGSRWPQVSHKAFLSQAPHAHRAHDKVAIAAHVLSVLIQIKGGRTRSVNHVEYVAADGLCKIAHLNGFVVFRNSSPGHASS